MKLFAIEQAAAAMIGSGVDTAQDLRDAAKDSYKIGDLANSGGEQIGMHTSRHSTAAGWLGQGVHVRRSPTLLGHSSISRSLAISMATTVTRGRGRCSNAGTARSDCATPETFRKASPARRREGRQSNPTQRRPVGPGQTWTLDVMLADPASWAIVVGSSGAGPVTPHLRCTLSVDGAVAATKEGPRGALCSLRSCVRASGVWGFGAGGVS